MNAVLYAKGTNTIKYFLKDCVRRGSHFVGSNAKIIANLKMYDVVWTNDVATQDSEGNWDKTVDQLNHEDRGVELGASSYQELKESLNKRELINNLSFSELETYIENNVTDFATAKDFIKILSQVTLALCKLIAAK